jgi:hypothetical protein
VTNTTASPKAYRFEDVINDRFTPLKEGDIIVDFKGDKWIFVALLPDGRGTNWKVQAKKPYNNMHQLFFPSIFSLDIRWEKIDG